MSARSERSARARGGNTATNSAVVLTGRNQLLRNPASALLIRRRLVHRLNEVIAELLRQLYWPRRNAGSVKRRMPPHTSFAKSALE